MVRRQIGLGCVLRVINFILGMGYFILGLSNFILDGVVRRQIGLGCVWQLDAICAALLHCGDGDTMCTNVSLIYIFKFPTPCPDRNAPGKLIKPAGCVGSKFTVDSQLEI